MRIFLMLLLSLSFSVQAKIKEPAVSLEENKLNVFFDAKNPAVFVGKKSVNVNASGAGSMVYPAGSAGVFLVSILAHAAVSGSVENKRLSMEQEAANQVLEPFANKISEVDSDFLWDEARISADLPKFKFFLSDKHLDLSRWELRTVPVFAMTQSKKSFIIYNTLTFTDRALMSAKKKPPRLKKGAVNPNEKLVVIVSDPVDEKLADEYWERNDALAFTSAVKELYLESFQLGVARQFEEAALPKSKQVTVKFLEDGLKKIERGYVISQTCKRTIFESLANEIKSVPNLDYAECATL